MFYAPVGDAQLSYALSAECEGDGGRRSSGTQEQNPPARQVYARFPASFHEAAAVGVVAAERRVIDYHGVHGSGEPGSFVHAVKQREYRPLVGHGDVETPEPQGRRSPHRQGQVIRLHVEGDVDVVQTVGCEGGVVHSRAQAVLDRVPDQGEQPRLTADHPLSPRPSLANPCETAVYPIQGAFRAFGLESGASAGLAGVELFLRYRMTGLYGQATRACRVASCVPNFVPNIVPNTVQKDVWLMQTMSPPVRV